jgi:O-antigen/teichoic acid export membrane protein
LKSEAAKGILRIISNYARLGANLLLGLILAPFMLAWVKNDAVSLVGLLGAGTGFAAMFREITERAVIRELARAYHSDDPAEFRIVFNSSLLVSAGAAGIVLLGFVGLYVAIQFRVLDIKPELIQAAYVLMLTQAVIAVYATLASPLFNMQVVKERFVLYNFWTLADRATFLVSAVIVRYGMHMSGEDGSRAIIRWTELTMVLELFAITTPMLVLMWQDARLRPALSLATRRAAREVFGTLRWQVGVEFAANMYDRAGFIFSNLAIGRGGNLVYGFGQQFVNYTSQVALGMSLGLDAISARLESKSGRSLPVLLHHSTRLIALVALPIGLVSLVLAPELIQIWLGRSIQDPGENIPRIAVTAQIMIPAITIRAIAGVWVAILYGAGHLRRYAPLLLIGGVINLVLTTVVLLVAHNSPELWKQYLIPGILAVVSASVYGLFIPQIAAPCLGVQVRHLYIPLIRPALATAACSPVLFVAHWVLARLGLTWNLLTMAGVGAVFGGLYALASSLIVLERAERVRFIWAPLRRLLGA